MGTLRHIYLGAFIGILAGTSSIYFLTTAGAESRVQVLKTQASVLPVVSESAPLVYSWEEITSSAPWAARDSHAVFVFNDHLWLMGGLNGNGFVNSGGVVQYWEAPHFNDTWTSRDGVLWSETTDETKWPPRRSMSIIEFQGSLWMLGGWSPISSYQSDIWRSEDGIHWNKVVSQAPWEPREGQIVEIFDDKLWMFGGVNYDRRKTYNDVWVSSDGTTWSRLTASAPWQSRWDHSVTSFKNKLFLIGGMNLSKAVFSDLWISDDGISWKRATSSPPWRARQGHSALVWDDTLWILGRLNDSSARGPNDIWFTRDGVSWQQFEGDVPWMGREDAGGVVFKDSMWILGGMGSDWQWKNDVWRFSPEN